MASRSQFLMTSNGQTARRGPRNAPRYHRGVAMARAAGVMDHKRGSRSPFTAWPMVAQFGIHPMSIWSRTRPVPTATTPSGPKQRHSPDSPAVPKQSQPSRYRHYWCSVKSLDVTPSRRSSGFHDIGAGACAPVALPAWHRPWSWLTASGDIVVCAASDVGRQVPRRNTV